MKPHIVFRIPHLMPEPTSIWEQNGWLLRLIAEDLHRFGGLRESILSYPDGSQWVQVLIDPELPGGQALLRFAAIVKDEMDRELAAWAAGKDFISPGLDWTWPARTAVMLDQARKWVKP